MLKVSLIGDQMKKVEFSLLFVENEELFERQESIECKKIFAYFLDFLIDFYENEEIKVLKFDLFCL